VHHFGWHAGSDFPAGEELERGLLVRLPLARGLPSGGPVLGGRYHEAGGPALAGLHPQDAGLQEHLVVEDASVLEPAPQGRDGRTGHRSPHCSVIRFQYDPYARRVPALTAADTTGT